MVEEVRSDSSLNTTLSQNESYAYYQGRIVEILKEGAFCALPIAPLITLFQSLVTNFWAHKIYNDTINDVESEDFVITENSIEKVADLYMERRVAVTGQKAEEVKGAIRKKLVETLSENVECISHLANQMGIITPVLSYHIPNTMEVLGTPMAEGKGFKIPVVRRTALPIVLNILSEEHASEIVNSINKGNNNVGRFVIAHEMIHLKNHHLSYKTAILVGICALNCFLWISGYRATVTWTKFFITTFLKLLPIQLITKVFENTLSQKFEKEADIGAMDTLDSNKGALALTRAMVASKHVGDAKHPPNKERLAYALAWKAKAS